MGEVVRTTDTGESALHVAHRGTGRSDNFALSVSSTPTSGNGGGLRVKSGNASAAAVQVSGAGDILDLRGSAGSSVFTVGQNGALQRRAAQVIEVDAPTGTAATDQAAIDAALARCTSSGWLVQLQAGTYVVPAPATASSGIISVSRNGTTVAGRGMGVTIIKVADGTSSDVTGVIRTQSGVENTNITFRDLTVDGNSDNVTGSVDGFYCGVTPNSSSTDTDIACINVEVKNTTGYGFDPHERTTRLRLINCVARSCGDASHDGFAIDACYDALIEGCTSYDAGRHGFNVVTASNRVRLIGCHAYNSASTGFTLQTGAKFVTLSACTAYNSTGAGFVINGVAQSGEQDNTAGGMHTLTGCTASTSGTHGFQLVGASYNRLIGCHSQDASQTTTNTSDHFRVADSGSDYSTYNTLIGCTWAQTSGVSNAAKYGVEEQSTSSGPTYLLGCTGTGTATGSISVSNATSKLVNAHNGSAGTHPIGVYSNDLPSLHGYYEWNFDPNISGASAGVAMVAGTVYGLRVDAQSGSQISNIVINIGTAGTSMTASQCYASVIDGTTGTELARTADIATTLQGSGITALALTAAFTPTIGQKLAVLILGNSSGSMPQLVRSSSTSATGPNAGLTSASPRRFFTAGTSQTSLASSWTMGNTTATGALAFWVALS